MKRLGKYIKIEDLGNTAIITYTSKRKITKTIYMNELGINIEGVLINNGTLSGYTPGSMSTQYAYYRDPVSTLRYRTGVRGDVLVTDRELTTTGFDGVENTDWESIQK